MSCREEILIVVNGLSRRRQDGAFTIQEVLDGMAEHDSVYSRATIRTHVAFIMCVNAPASRGVRHRDLERVERGRYRLIQDRGPGS